MWKVSRLTYSYPDTLQGAPPPDLAPGVGPTRAFLSAESLQQFDAGQDQLDMVAKQFDIQGSLDDLPSDDEDSSGQDTENEQVDDTLAEVQEHLEQREDFRTYLMSLPGSESVRFYKRYGSWTGQATFNDSVAAAQAVQLFNTQRFPSVRVHQSSQVKNKVKFAASNPPRSKGTSSRSPFIMAA